jgi:hypothetical protein
VLRTISVMKVLLGLLILAALASCQDSLQKKDLIGFYVFSTWNRDTLELHENGTYSHYMLDSGKRIIDSGSWTLNEAKTEVKFENFSFSLLEKESTGSWFSKLRINDDAIHLMYASEENIYYEKIK